ncbi:MAG: glutathione S-transferase family protein [Hyphomicrobiales bacterium]
MLKLYNAGTSVCSVKVRLGLAEKGIEWEDVLLVLPKDEQFDPEYLKLNANGVVPTLVHDDLVITESSIILEYIDTLDASSRLMPQDTASILTTKLWLLRCLDIHSAVNTLTFSTVKRDSILANQSPDQIQASIAKMPNPKMADKRRDLLKNGVNSSHVVADFFTLKRTFDDMQRALEKTEWLTGDQYGLADVALTSYVDRLDHLGCSGLWEERTPLVGSWLNAARQRPNYSRAMERYLAPNEVENTQEAGKAHWPKVRDLWAEFVS